MSVTRARTGRVASAVSRCGACIRTTLFELQWGHVTRTDAYYCIESRRPGVWPTPAR
ncbi:hypothetical protein PBI_WINKY_110 [Mycobacterium phage Winky]|nr:hypothetical protein PBI_WINKY_110 [Mycobacterium phage Winky]